MEAGKDTSFEEQEHECVIGGVVNRLNRPNHLERHHLGVSAEDLIKAK